MLPLSNSVKFVIQDYSPLNDQVDIDCSNSVTDGIEASLLGNYDGFSDADYKTDLSGAHLHVTYNTFKMCMYASSFYKIKPMSNKQTVTLLLYSFVRFIYVRFNHRI